MCPHIAPVVEQRNHHREVCSPIWITPPASAYHSPTKPQRRRLTSSEPVIEAKSIHPDDFVKRVKPLLESQDLQGLLALLRARWSKDQIREVLNSSHGDARKIACLALGLVGARCSIAPLVSQLKDPDPMANEMAEHALWSIWFRCGSQQANDLLTAGAAAMDDREFERAEELFTQAIHTDPTFAEAYNQRAIVRYLQERYEPSVQDCREVVKRMPCHFGAWAGMGHGHAHQAQIPEAILCYEKALEINPHLECIAEAVEELKRQQAI